MRASVLRVGLLKEMHTQGLTRSVCHGPGYFLVTNDDDGDDDDDDDLIMMVIATTLIIIMIMRHLCNADLMQSQS